MQVEQNAWKTVNVQYMLAIMMMIMNIPDAQSASTELSHHFQYPVLQKQ